METMPICAAREITNQIYDTIMQNVGMSELHTEFDPKTVTMQEMYHHTGLSLIYLELGNKVFEIQVKEITKDYFNEG